MTTSRGHNFETHIAALLRAGGFEVTPNAKAATPRQTDLFARADNVDLLIEVKDRKRRIDVNDIDALRARLGRVASDIVGVIFTTSELTGGAIKAIESDRQREVLIFVKDEIDRLHRAEQNLKMLIERKRKELRVGGKVWFGINLGSEYAAVSLPIATIAFKLGSKAWPYIEFKSSFSGACFALQIPDPGWGMSGGEGARLTIDLTLNTIKDLRNIFGYLHEQFGLSKNGMFSIQQSECCWYGAGPENFLQTLDAWSERYSKSKSKRFHHAESFVYFDQFRNGWVEISAQQHFSPSSDGNHESSLFHSELVIQLPGIPVDTSPFLKLCRYAGADWASFEFIGSRWTLARRLKKPFKLQVLGTIIDRVAFSNDKSERPETVIGIVARNPLYRAKALPVELLEFDHGAQQELKETESIPCALRDWHDVDMAVDYYRLTGFEITTGGVNYVIRPFGTWNKRLE